VDDQARDLETVRLLEARRLALDAAKWQGPSLLLVVQAFLLGVLTNEHVKLGVAIVVAVAGIAALVVVGISLGQQHNRERALSVRIEAGASAAGLTQLRRSLPARRWWPPLEWPGWVLWVLVFALFGLADVAALVFTHRT
jgi:hypothetical protein